MMNGTHPSDRRRRPGATAPPARPAERRGGQLLDHRGAGDERDDEQGHGEAQRGDEGERGGCTQPAQPGGETVLSAQGAPGISIVDVDIERRYALPPLPSSPDVGAARRRRRRVRGRLFWARPYVLPRALGQHIWSRGVSPPPVRDCARRGSCCSGTPCTCRGCPAPWFRAPPAASPPPTPPRRSPTAGTRPSARPLSRAGQVDADQPVRVLHDRPLTSTVWTSPRCACRTTWP